VLKTLLLYFEIRENKETMRLSATEAASLLTIAALLAVGEINYASANSLVGRSGTGWVSKSITTNSWNLIPRGGSTKKKATAAADSEPKIQQEPAPLAEALYLPGLLRTVIKRTNKVCYNDQYYSLQTSADAKLILKIVVSRMNFIFNVYRKPPLVMIQQ
jgi:hypothetical protein